MFLLEIYFTLTLIVFIFTIPFYISRIREFRSIKAQYSILLLLIIMYTMYYEMKEKFEKKYFNKGKKISKK